MHSPERHQYRRRTTARPRHHSHKSFDLPGVQPTATLRPGPRSENWAQTGRPWTRRCYGGSTSTSAAPSPRSPLRWAPVTAGSGPRCSPPASRCGRPAAARTGRPCPRSPPGSSATCTCTRGSPPGRSPPVSVGARTGCSPRWTRTGHPPPARRFPPRPAPGGGRRHPHRPLRHPPPRSPTTPSPPPRDARFQADEYVAASDVVAAPSEMTATFVVPPRSPRFFTAAGAPMIVTVRVREPLRVLVVA